MTGSPQWSLPPGHAQDEALSLPLCRRVRSHAEVSGLATRWLLMLPVAMTSSAILAFESAASASAASIAGELTPLMCRADGVGRFDRVVAASRKDKNFAHRRIAVPSDG
jgi:hypothetical protein